METTYTIASEQGSIAVTTKNIHSDGHVVAYKYVANRDGSFTGFDLNKAGKWVKKSWGAMAAKRFAWQKEAADKYFAA